MRISRLLYILASLLLMGVTAQGAVGAEGSGWALVSVPMAPMRSEPRHSAELDTQYLLGTPVRIDSLVGEWILSTGPDGYQGYMPARALWLTDSVGLARWQQQPRYLVVDRLGAVLRDSLDFLVSPLPFGSIIEADTVSGCITLPDGRRGYADGLLLPFEGFRSAQLLSDTLLTALALTMTGVPYFWGGTTADALDCSGLTSLCYRMAGVILPRNASAQARLGREVAIDCDSLRPGDLVFMGPDAQQRRVTHVAMYLGDGRVIHSSGLVHQSSLDPDAPDYLDRAYVVARRYIEDGRFISGAGVAVGRHPWYFPQSCSLALPDVLLQ